MHAGGPCHSEKKVNLIADFCVHILFNHLAKHKKNNSYFTTNAYIVKKKLFTSFKYIVSIQYSTGDIKNRNNDVNNS